MEKARVKVLLTRVRVDDSPRCDIISATIYMEERFMAYKISEECISCGACAPECPTEIPEWCARARVEWAGPRANPICDTGA